MPLAAGDVLMFCSVAGTLSGVVHDPVLHLPSPSTLSSPLSSASLHQKKKKRVYESYSNLTGTRGAGGGGGWWRYRDL